MSEIFDIKSYCKYNPDLQNLNDEQLINHWNNFGKLENRVYYKPKNIELFSSEIYKLCNEDLNGKSDLELEIHYVNHGILEERICSVDTYLKHNPQLNKTEYTEEKIIEHLKKKKICVKLIGGLGNQIFMLLNMLSLGEKYNMDCYIHEKYEDTKRKSFYNYSFFKNIKTIENYNEFETFTEKEFKYNEIKLNEKNNYFLSGYFQSYKYFWDNRNIIKKQIHIDENIKNKIKLTFEPYKKIIAIHLRLGDYLKLPDYHPTMPIEYYKKALSYYNLDNYQIILFSDDVELAGEKLSSLNLNYICAGDLFDNDEEEFYALCLSDVRICANSSFSLMSCYFNEIFNFKENCEYIFPNVWFGPKGPKYEMDDIMPNYKFHVINLQNISYDVKYDVVTTIHSKDKNRYEIFNKYNKKKLVGSGKMYYVSYKDFNNEMNYISEKLYPFSKQDVIDYIKDYVPNYRWGWYYQQLLKLYIFEVYDFENENILIFDSDILLLKNITLFYKDKMKLFKRLTDTQIIHEPYVKTINYVHPHLNIDRSNSGICHMMLFNKNIIKQLFLDIANIHNKDVWKVCLDGVIDYTKKNGYNISILSEYELYYNYVKNKYMDKYIVDDNFKYLDISYNLFDFYRNKNKYYYIADHHYQSRKECDHEVDNLMDKDINTSYNIISINKISNLKLNKYVNYIFKKYYDKNKIIHYDDSYNTDDNMLDVLFEKLVPNTKISNILNIFYENNYSKIDVINIVRNENLILVKKIRCDIDNVINSYIDNNILCNNTFIKKISVNNIQLNNDKCDFGIIVPVFNRYNITKIFIECIKMNTNYESVIFCFVDDGSDDNVLNELDQLSQLSIKTIIIYCDRKKNIYGSNNTLVPGSLYPLTLYMGHEIIKNNCNILGVLDSDSFINENYFNDAKLFTNLFDMNDTIFSGFNSHSESHKIIDEYEINDKKILKKNMVGGISQFYSVKLYEQFKYKFTGEESYNYWAYDYDFQISNFINKTNRQYVCLKYSNIQHIGIKSTMIRCGISHNHNDNNITNIVYKLLTNPTTKKDIDIEFDFDENFIGSRNTNKIFNKIKQFNYLNLFIDKIYYINLDERTDRKKIIEEQFDKYNITNFERINAITPNFNYKYSEKFIDEQIELFVNNNTTVDDLIEKYNTNYISGFDRQYIKSKNKNDRKKYILGALGCKLSHLKIYEKSKKMKNILIFEDDALFHDNFNYYINKLNDNLKNINYDYDMIWLSPNWLLKNNNNLLNRCNSYKHINETFAKVSSELSCDNRLGSTSNAAGLIVSNKIINYISDNYASSNHEEIDLWYRIHIQSKNNTFTTIPNLIRQRVEKSNIESDHNLVHYDIDIHYKTRKKFNIYSFVEKEQKDIFYKNLQNNLKKMIGYEKIYYISDEKLFDNDMLHYINKNEIIKKCNTYNINILKKKITCFLNDNSIKYFYYMDAHFHLENDYYPFDENNELINNKNMFVKKNILEYFVDKIYYINLEERTDRKKIIEEQFDKYNINNYERFSAIKPIFNKKYDENFINNQIELYLNDEKIVDDLIENYDIKYIFDLNKDYIKLKSLDNRKKYILGALGCKMSHYEIYKKCEGHENIMIIEDDALFHHDFNNHMCKLYNNLSNINFEYDMIWLSPNWLFKNNDGILNRCNNYKYICDGFAKISGDKYVDGNFGSTQNTAGLIINNNTIKNILNIFKNTKQQEIDIWYRINIQSKNNTYTPIPNLITQRFEKSNIEEYTVDYSKGLHYKTREKFNIFTILHNKNKELYYKNLKNNLLKMIGYENIYYICDKKIFDNDILIHVNINEIYDDIDFKNINKTICQYITNYLTNKHDSKIVNYYYMDIDEYLTNEYLPFDNDNNLVNNKNMFVKNK